MIKIKSEKGQVVILLLLVMVIALAIGLSTINRSVVEVSTSRKSEDSSRAFSAAEAGMEKAIQANLTTLGSTPVPVPPINLGNQANANIEVSSGGLPLSGKALAYPPFGKESFAQFWLIDSSNLIKSTAYSANSYDIYFGLVDPDGTKYDTVYGGNPQDKPAIEVATIYWDDINKKYQSLPKYFDSFDGIGVNVRSDGFNPCNTFMPSSIYVNDDIEPTSFYCKVTVDISSIIAGNSFPIMVRVRILYTNLAHPVAIQPASGYNIPKQANIYTSSGTSGDVRRKLEVFNQKAVMPQFFDYVLFSASDLQKL